MDETMEMKRQLFDLDYFAPIHLSKIVLKDMIEKKIKGQIALISSVAKYGSYPVCHLKLGENGDCFETGIWHRYLFAKLLIFKLLLR